MDTFSHITRRNRINNSWYPGQSPYLRHDSRHKFCWLPDDFVKDTKNINARSEVNISSKIIELFGSSGVSAGASFLEKLMAGSEHSQV
jgi:hypothetical protein